MGTGSTILSVVPLFHGNEYQGGKQQNLFTISLATHCSVKIRKEFTVKLKSLTCLCLSFIMVVGTVTAPLKAVASEENIYTVYESQLSYVVNEAGSSSYGILDEEDGIAKTAGIRAFEVLDDGRVMVLDASTGQILVYRDSELESSISISFCVDPQYFVFQDDEVVIFDLTSTGKLYYVDLNGNIVNEKVLTEDVRPSTITGFYLWDGEYYLITLDKELLSLSDLNSIGSVFETYVAAGNYIVSYDEMIWNLEKGSRDFFNPLYVDNDGNLYIEKSTVAQNTEYIQGETYLLKLDNNGNEVASMRLKLEDYEAFPNQFYDFCNGVLYVLELFENSCNVARVVMGTQRETSRIAEMEQQSLANKRESKASKRAANAISVSKTRDEVKTTASDIISTSWTVNSGNKTVVSGAKLPKCVADVSVGSTVTGIPYCWGGYNTLNSIVQSLSNGSMAGNVNKTIISGPVGYDCSGFVSLCYGLGQHVATSNLATSVSVSQIDYANMQSMDMILKSGHVMLFKEFSGTSNNYVTVYEATSEGQQKTREHSYTINHIFVTLSYKAYTPW